MSQLSFSSLDFAAKKKTTKREIFLTEMEAAVPWGKLSTEWMSTDIATMTSNVSWGAVQEEVRKSCN